MDPSTVSAPDLGRTSWSWLAPLFMLLALLFLIFITSLSVIALYDLTKGKEQFATDVNAQHAYNYIASSITIGGIVSGIVLAVLISRFVAVHTYKEEETSPQIRDIGKMVPWGNFFTYFACIFMLFAAFVIGILMLMSYQEIKNSNNPVSTSERICRIVGGLSIALVGLSILTIIGLALQQSYMKKSQKKIEVATSIAERSRSVVTSVPSSSSATPPAGPVSPPDSSATQSSNDIIKFCLSNPSHPSCQKLFDYLRSYTTR